jgi:hypothetical protein
LLAPGPAISRAGEQAFGNHFRNDIPLQHHQPIFVKYRLHQTFFAFDFRRSSHCTTASSMISLAVKVKFADFELISRSRTVARAIDRRSAFENVSADLLKALFPMQKAVRLLGVSISGFDFQPPATGQQIELL